VSILQLFTFKSDAKKPAVANSENLELLRDCSVLASVSESGLAFLASRLVTRRYTRREMIFRNDNPGVCMFIIQNGEVELFIEDENDTDASLGLLGKGALFGEIATICSTHRTASARANCNDTHLLSISKFDLEDMQKRFPQDGLEVQRGVSMSIVDSLVVTTLQVKEAERKIKSLQKQLGRELE